MEIHILCRKICSIKDLLWKNWSGSIIISFSYCICSLIKISAMDIIIIMVIFVIIIILVHSTIISTAWCTQNENGINATKWKQLSSHDVESYDGSLCLFLHDQWSKWVFQELYIRKQTFNSIICDYLTHSSMIFFFGWAP